MRSAAHETVNKAGFVSEQWWINDNFLDQGLDENEGRSLVSIRNALLGKAALPPKVEPIIARWIYDY